MSSKVVSGKDLAARIRNELGERAARVKESLGRPPGLAVILVGDDPGSSIYVRNKERAANKIGVASQVIRMPEESQQDEVLAAVNRLNNDVTVDGFLVQLPLPSHVDTAAITLAIDPDKDADGLLPENLGRLMAGVPGPRPCTPSGVMALLDEGGVDLKGARAVVIGRSTIVGKPQAMMLLERHATVTLCHSRTRNLEDEVRRADVVIAAVGKAGLVTGDWLKEGAAVVDVGINRVDGKVVGDVDFASAEAKASMITPVPGGVGPMTIAMLLKNAVEAAERKV